jgi:hypothetical protein
MSTVVTVLVGCVVTNAIVTALDTQALSTVVLDVSVRTIDPMGSLIPGVEVRSSHSVVVNSEFVTLSVGDH